MTDYVGDERFPVEDLESGQNRNAVRPEASDRLYLFVGLLLGFGLGMITAVLIFKTVDSPIIVIQEPPAAESGRQLGYDG